jgi:hypothetical protein
VVDRKAVTGVALVGRRAVEQVDHYEGDHHGAPIFVLSDRLRPALAVIDTSVVCFVSRAKAEWLLDKSP